MFGNVRNMNNNGNGVNVNSNLYISYSDTCMLKLGAWNTQLSLKFHPFKGLNGDGIRQYAQDNTEIINTSLTVDNTSALLDGIKDEIKPALEKKEKKSVSVPVGSGANKKVVTISTEEGRVKISVVINVTDDGKANPENKIEHMFNLKEYIVDYDPETGSGEVIQTNTDFENFVIKLKDVYKLTAAVAHSINYNNALKSSFSNRNAMNNNMNNQQGYQAPQSNIPNGDMSFLPFN